MLIKYDILAILAYKKQKANNERFGDLADRMNKLFGEDWSNGLK